MTNGALSFLDSDSKWTSGPSIATYIILAGLLISLFFTGKYVYSIVKPESVTGEASIEGKIERAGTEVPIEGVLVSLEGTEDFTYTDVNGQYYLNDTKAGVQIISYQKPGYQTKRVEYFFQEDLTEELDTLSLEVVKTKTYVNPNKKGSVSGTVYWEKTDNPVEGAKAWINGSSIDYSEVEKEVFSEDKNDITEADGKFALSAPDVGILELVVVIEFDDALKAELKTDLRYYMEVVTFFPTPDEDTVIDIVVNPAILKNQDDVLFPYTYVNQRSVLEEQELLLNIETPQKVETEPLEISVYRSHTQELLKTIDTKARNVNFTLDQGLYDVKIICQNCNVTWQRNVSVSGDTTQSVKVPFGKEAEYFNEVDTSGYFLCLIPSVILLALTGLGAYYCFTRKKFFLSLLGAIALVPQQSIVLGSGSFTCITVNLILGVVAALIIFKSRPLFDDSPKPDDAMIEAEAAREEAESKKDTVVKTSPGKKKKRK